MMQLTGIRTFAIAMTFAGALLLANSQVNAAYYFSYSPAYIDSGPNTNFSTNPTSYFITNEYDKYSALEWEIVSAEETAQGGVFATYGIKNWYDIGYGNVAYIDFSFQILHDDGSLIPEPVMVDAWGAFELNKEVWYHGYPDIMAGDAVCCTAEMLLEVSFISGEGAFSGQVHKLGGTDSDSFFGSYEILTNTTYNIFYRGIAYGETNSDFHTDFSSWADYYAFVDSYGSSGTNTMRSSGFFQHGVVLRSVPEPTTLALLGLGLVGMGFARRRKTS